MALNPLAEHLWETKFRIGKSRVEKFLILRDEDWTQIVHPTTKTAEEGVPIVGPDDTGASKYWVVTGKQGEMVHVQLGIAEGCFIVSLRSKSCGERTWHSNAESVFHLAGTWNEWGLHELNADPKVRGLYRGHFVVGEDCFEQFQIVRNQDWNQVLHPNVAGVMPGQTVVFGPDDGGQGLNWQINAHSGQAVEIILDSKTEDRRKIVTCRLLDHK